MANVLYVRNTRPNAVLLRSHGVKYTVERRGSREDSVALPGDWRDDPVVATFIQRGILEEISKEAFMQLGSRPEQTEERVFQGKKVVLSRPVTDVPLVERKAEREVNILINNPEESRQPFLITDAELRGSAPLRSPRPEFAGVVPSTEEDLAKIEAARQAVERAANELPVDETADLRNQVATLTNLVQELLARQPQVGEAGETATPKKATRKKAATSTAAKRGRPRKTAE